VIDLDRGDNAFDIKDRVWLYEERKYNTSLIF
jgi:hypothetical protein